MTGGALAVGSGHVDALILILRMALQLHELPSLGQVNFVIRTTGPLVNGQLVEQPVYDVFVGFHGEDWN
jgi:hypothetical protein